MEWVSIAQDMKNLDISWPNRVFLLFHMIMVNVIIFLFLYFYCNCIYSYINLHFSFCSILIFEDSFVNHVSVKLISSIKIIIIIVIIIIIIIIINKLISTILFSIHVNDFVVFKESSS